MHCNAMICIHRNIIIHYDVIMDVPSNTITHCDFTMGILANAITHCDVILIDLHWFDWSPFGEHIPVYHIKIGYILE